MIKSALYCLSNFPNSPQTYLFFRMSWKISGQSSSDRCSIRHQYVKESTPPKHSNPSYPVRLKVALVHFAAISTSLLCHLIFVLLSHRAVRRCWWATPMSFEFRTSCSGAVVPLPPGPTLSMTENIRTWNVPTAFPQIVIHRLGFSLGFYIG